MRHSLETFVPHVYRFALRLTGDAHEAEDLAQEVMLRAWRRIRQLRDPRAARVWLLRITANRWKDELRRRRRDPSPRPLEEHQAEDVTASPSLHVVHKEQLQKALRALDALPERQREVLYLHVCEGLALEEIATVLDIGYGAAKASLSVGRKRLRSQLGDLLEEMNTSTGQRG